MGNMIFNFNKWAVCLSTMAVMGTIACVQSDSDEQDFESPRLTVMSPQEGQVFKVGDTIHIMAMLTDNESLHEYAWGIYDTAGVIVPSNFGLAHDTKEHTMMGVYVVSGITTATLWSVWVHADDYEHNYEDKTINIIVSP
jgi:hypothetical protein